MRLATVPLIGDPSHVCDLVAAGIADEYLRRDPETRIECHVSGGRGAIFVTGETLTQADFDVSLLVQRLLGQCGVYDQMEPFIALEPVSSEQIGLFRQACREPALVFGYATRETDEFMPAPLYWSQKIVQALEGRRKHDPDWFWLGASGQVSVLGQGKRIDEVIVEVDHGTHPLDLVRAAIAQEIEEQDLHARLQINVLGESQRGGIESNIGSKKSHLLAYGENLPPIVNPAGRDWHGVEVYGVWLARYIALEVLKSTQAQAVMTELFFLPGDVLPSRITARDERGQDLSEHIKLTKDVMTELLADWRLPGVMVDVARGGAVGSHALPWEKSSLSTLPFGA
ncbi:MAG: S-adenosylmethionine synthetase N-terminal domain-containing protein [Patescibacteria group bacterium]|jgi:S-adenosylmethionine synthetase